jgi:hypothetical protein
MASATLFELAALTIVCDGECVAALGEHPATCAHERLVVLGVPASVQFFVE